jgi:isopropylmalate/homocitrate/citramalate synthase
VTAGAHPDVAVNGVAYRSGFAALEEVVVGLELLYDARTSMRLEKLKHLSDVVAERGGLPLYPLKAITGRHSFIRDADAWVLPLLQKGFDTFPAPGSCFAPSIVGQRFKIVWGTHLSSSLIRAKLRQMNLTLAEEDVQRIREEIEGRLQAIEQYPFWVPDEDVEEICRAVAERRIPAKGVN